MSARNSLTSSAASASGGYTPGFKVDVSRGQRISRVSSEWFSRPDDERYLSLSELYGAFRLRANRASAQTVESRLVRVEASRDDAARDLPSRGGCYAEYLMLPAACVHVVNDNVDLCEAVCLSNYQAAWAPLHDAPGGKKLRTILVIGAAGGVGSAIVQLAKLEGMRVIGTVSSPQKAEFARAMGADDIIFYRDEDVIARTAALTDGRGVDLILDHVGGPDFVRTSKSWMNGAW